MQARDRRLLYKPEKGKENKRSLPFQTLKRKNIYLAVKDFENVVLFRSRSILNT